MKVDCLGCNPRATDNCELALRGLEAVESILREANKDAATEKIPMVRDHVAQNPGHEPVIVLSWGS